MRRVNYKYDLSCFESCMDFLKSFLGIDNNRLKDFIVSQNKKEDFSDQNLDTFIENFEINLSDCDQDKIIFCGVHITTNKDRCESIKKYGILNTQQVLTLDTPLRKLFYDFGFEFDFVHNDIIKAYQDNEGMIKTKVFNLDKLVEKGYLKGRAKVKLTSVSHYPVNAFLSIDSYTSYGGNVHQMPEIVRDLSYSTNNKDFEEEWKKNLKGYVIKFYAPFSSCNFNHIFNGNRRREILDIENNYEELKRYILKECILSCIRHYNDIEAKEIQFYLKAHAYVPFEDIYEIIHIDSNELIYSRDN